MTMTISVKGIRQKAALLCAGLLAPLYMQAQTAATSQPATIPLTDLSAFKNPGKTWQLAGDVSADLGKDNSLSLSKGTGVLVNLPDKKNHGEDLYTTAEHGDAQVEFDYMIAKGSNSGVYLQGRYELQLLDSWNVKTPKASDNGGIYERWDDSKPEGQKGYEGYPPRQNASRAPGLWQHLKVMFQAPKFDGSGKKMANARMLRVELNGVVIHEELELLGPTRGAMANDEKATGPLRFQGDHGAIAFRNISISNLPATPMQANSRRNDNPVDPILVEAPTNTILRSFMDIPGQPRTRVVHAVSVGSPQKVHYTYDLDKGAVIQVWRGNFLDATPMWHDRGDGSSRPAGAVQRFGLPKFALAKLGSAQAAWIADSAGTSFRPKGYTLDENDQPTFTYRIYGATVSDAIRVMDNGQGIHREITVQNPAGGELYARLAEGTTIEEDKSNGAYLVDGKAYYLRLDDAKGTKPVVRDADGRKELVVPVKGKVGYSILF
ncbi:3-keto-disaccharide hydrolase [Adhaeribacter pallidiroseus]|uniref:3-keto-alpha-glucoside-1,2-lyase/3-keto-2-hydroxy-glucal hydratase domain-containing protein n=2 Tax=Adhaeribacter pallidiroseus TaxID=2072847 RepID=A0A369QKN0_9BACT|nr:hypothetical protein AHMF7616_03564 [Adhaeribacter pallidiroseus]